jgi:Glyoxalase-like domain
LEPDHLIVWGDVERVGEHVGRSLGVTPVDGGVHPGAGTRNVLFALDGDRFLEVLGPDPAQPTRSFGPAMDHAEGALWWWAARTGGDLRDVVVRLRGLGVDSGPIEPGERIRPSGERLAWETLDPSPAAFGVALPFVIRWAEAPPVRGGGSAVVAFHLVHPDAAGLEKVVAALGLDTEVRVVHGDEPALRTVVEGPGGTLELATP